MHARVARYTVPPDRIDEAAEAFHSAAEGLSSLDGFVNGYLMTEPGSGAIFTVTFWRDHRALDESATRAGAMRLRAVRELDGSCDSVADYEVPLTFGSSP